MQLHAESTSPATHDPARPGAPDLYRSVHKGIRNALQSNLIRLGQLDVGDTAAVSLATAALTDLLDWLHEHLTIEDRFIHAAIESRRPDELPPQARQDHAQHRREIGLLREEARALDVAAGLPASARESIAQRLYLAYSRFVGENLVHMAFEETGMNQCLWRLFSDDELHGILGRIMASESPSQLARAVRWIVPALSPDERAEVVLGARATVDPAVFAVLLRQIRSLLDPRDAEKLARALGGPVEKCA